MTHNQRLMTIATMLSLAGTGAIMASAHEVWQGSPCRTASDTAAVAVTFAKRGLTDNDSSGLVALGLPYKPSQASIVSDSVTCQAVVNSYNAALADTSQTIMSGYVVQAGSAFLLYLPSLSMSYFDANRRFLFTQAFLN